MTTTVRYKFVENSLGAALTTSNFPYNTDGDDRPLKVVKREIVTADVGTGAGQLGHALGAIIDVVPNTSNVLWVIGFVSRATGAVSGITPYTNIMGKIFPVASPVTSITQVQVQFALGLDNTIRAIDLSQGTTAALALGDVITVFVISGPASDALDSMN